MSTDPAAPSAEVIPLTADAGTLEGARKILRDRLRDPLASEIYLLSGAELQSWRTLRDHERDLFLIYRNDARRALGKSFVAMLDEAIELPASGTRREIELFTPGELLARPAPLDLIRGVLPAKGNAVIFGETGSGKTHFATHTTLAVVRGVPSFGRRVRQGGAVYVAAEGTLRGRLEAYALHHGVELDGLPIRIIEQPIRLRGPGADTPRLIERVKVAAGELGCIALLVLDTFNRTLAGGNENASEDVGEYLDSLAAIGEALDCLCLIVHHSGKNSAAGARGHSSLKGNIDAEIEVTEDASGIRTATVTKARDGIAGDTFSFRLEAVDLGPHPHPDADDMEHRGSCVVVPIDYTPARQAKKRKLTADEEIALQTLREVASEGGEPLPETSVVPIGVTQGVKVESWRTRFYDRLGGKRDTEQSAKRQAFGRGRKGLVAKGYAGMHGEWAWAVTQRDKP
jgi:AAA domain-containing protein